jgi:hypothetical protein
MMRDIIKYTLLIFGAHMLITWLTKPAFAIGLLDNTRAERSVASSEHEVGSAQVGTVALKQTQPRIVIKQSVKQEIGIDVSTLDLSSAEYVDLNRALNQGRLKLNCVLSFYDHTGALQVYPQAWGYAFELNTSRISVDFEQWSREAGVRMVYFQHRIDSNKCLLATGEST